MTQSSNPLQNHFRRPVIYYKLPSQGRFWAENAVELTVTGELPVLPMTTKDEITIRTPDALLNGQGVVDVIASCVPNIKDPWQMPSVDVDATLIAIRIASYSNMMDVDTKCPHCGEENSYSVDLNNILSAISMPDYDSTLNVDNLTIKFKPQPYYNVNKANLVQFEEQKLLSTISDRSLSDEEKSSIFSAQLSRVAELNTQIYVNSTESITTEDGIVVTDRNFIEEFYRNVSREIGNAVKISLENFSETAKIKPVDVTCGECHKSFKVNITFDHSNFFD